MRHISDFSDDWTINATAPDAEEYAPAVVRLPFIHSAADIGHLTLHKTFVCRFPVEKNLFLEIDGVTGHAGVYCNGKKLTSHNGMQTMFRAALGDNVKDGDEFIIRIEINPRPRCDGKITVGRIRLVFAGDSRFASGFTGFPGARVAAVSDGDGYSAVIYSETQGVTNYDIITAVLKDPSGQTAAVKNTPALTREITLPVGQELVYSEENTALPTVELSLFRDSRVLDNITVPAAVYVDELKDGAFYRNGIKTPLRGFMLTDFSSVRRDLDFACETGLNSALVGGLAPKSDIFSLLDGCYYTGWYLLPFTGRKTDFNCLTETLAQNCAHPSFRFVCCDPDADSAYRSRFVSAVNKAQCGVIPVWRCDVAASVPYDDCPPVIMADIRCDRDTNPVQVSQRFDTLAFSCPPGTLFAVNLTPPAVGGFGGMTALEACRLQREIFTLLSKRKDVIAYFAGEIRGGEMNNGIAPGYALTPAGCLLKAQQQREEYLKIEADGSVRTADKNFSFTVFSNNPAFKLLVNGKLTDNFTVGNPAPGVYVIGGIRLTGKINLIEISAGEQCDNLTVYRVRK